jgi:hypothetical protein
MQWFPGGARDEIISFIGISVIAKNDRLVSAAAFSDDGLNNRIFFYTLTTNDEADYHAAYETYAKRKNLEIATFAKGFPILQALRQGNIIPGTNVEAIIENWRPPMITRFGHWMILRWYPENLSEPFQYIFGVRTIAKDGVLVYANSFSDDGHCSTYFDEETPQDKEDFDADYQSAAAAIWERERISSRNVSVDVDTNSAR